VFGSEGRGGGPDLSTAVKRFRRSEILEAIMFPSKVISDQYTALIVEASGPEPMTGMLADENDETLTLIDASGERIEIPTNLITDRRTSEISIMPEDVLETLTLQDLVNLFLFLERGSGF
jgi:putative heme-binding domain-containing protein